MEKTKNQNNEITTVRMLWSSYSRNPELIELEKQGILRGLRRGKTMDVPLVTLYSSLRKQYKDWLVAYDNKNILEMKTALADLGNVAGIIFLKLNEGGNRK